MPKSKTLPTALIFSGYGLNCEEETKFAFEQAGGAAEIVYINDVISGHKKLANYQILAFPGGFSFGDDTGSGNAFAQKLKNHIWDELAAFVDQDHLVIGICNGFQILVNLGLVPALEKKYGERQVSLLHNDSVRYTTRWVDLKITSHSPWLKGITHLSLPIAHGEGKIFADPTVLAQLKRHKLIAARYVKGDACAYQNLPANPNGSLFDIAALTDVSGRILGMMPHPERAIAFTHLPNWPQLKEQCRRDGAPLPTTGPGLEIFENAVKYFGANE